MHIIKPAFRATEDSVEQSQCLAAIAQCSSTLELTGTSSQSARAGLETILPLYEVPNDSVTANPIRLSKRQVFDDIPLSEAEISATWKELVAFESDDKLACFCPSAGALVQAWSHIVSVAAIEKIDLCAPLPRDSVQQIADSAEGIPRDLIRAVVDHLTIEAGEEHQLDSDRTVSFIGRSLIQDLVEAPEKELIRQWQNLLPEAWRNMPDAELISVCHRHATTTRLTRIGHLQQELQYRSTSTASCCAWVWTNRHTTGVYQCQKEVARKVQTSSE